MQLTKHIYQIYGGMYGNIANIYAIETETSVILIDSAETMYDFKQLQENLMLDGLNKPVSAVLLTHKHFNHIGNAKRFKDLGADIIAGDKDSDAIEQGILNEIIDYSPFPLKEEYLPVNVDLRVHDGSCFEVDGVTFNVISAEGHTDGSVIYQMMDENQIVWFTGDVFTISDEGKTVKLGWKGGVDYRPAKVTQTVNKLQEYSADIICPGHGQTMMNNAKQCIELLKALI